MSDLISGETGTAQRKISPLLLWRVYFALLILLGIGAIGLMLQSPSETGQFLGLSTARGVIFVIGLCILTAAGLALLTSWRKPQACLNLIGRLVSWLDKPPHWGRLVLLNGLLLIVGSYQLTLLPNLEEPYTAKLMARLAPLTMWIAGSCALTLAALIYVRFGKDSLKLRPKGAPFWLTLAYFAGIFLIWGWVIRTIYPIAAGKRGWNLLGTPILEYQILIALLSGILLLWLTRRFHLARAGSSRLAKLVSLKRSSCPPKITPRKADLIIACVIWLSAVILWQTTPITSNWFLSEKLDPNEEYYPYSDARYYDRVAQSALIGEGFKFFNGWDVRRPLHGAYLTVLHLIAGQDYEKVISLQVLFLALLPVVIYFLASALHQRASGVIAAGLVILREINSISITSSITTSNVKLLMVDLLVALGAIWFAILAIKWLQRISQQSAQQSWLALASGSALGLVMLIRLETVALSLSPALIAGLILLPKKHYARWCKQMVLFFMGIALVISPWVVRNWQRTGLIFIDSPTFRFGLVYQRFEEPAATPQPTALPTSAASTPIPTSVPQPISQDIGRAILQQPGELISFALAHFTNSQIQAILIFPTAYRGLDSAVAFLAHGDLARYLTECCSLANYKRQMPYWRTKWDGAVPSQSVLPILFSVLILAAGVQAAWNKRRLLSLTPTLSFLFYAGFNAVLRNSGGRYLLPIDWSAMIFFSLGITQIAAFILESFSGQPYRTETALQTEAVVTPLQSKPLFSNPWLYLTAGAFLISCAIPLIERSFPQQYTPARKEQMLAAVYNSPALPENTELELKTFLSKGGMVIAGRGLYPQFFPANFGTEDIDYAPLAPRPYPRMVFNLTAAEGLDLALPFEQRTFNFPNASDILVFLCQNQASVSGDPLAVAVFDANNRLTNFYLRTPYPAQPACPLPVISGGN